jgi:hypothetical protein
MSDRVHLAGGTAVAVTGVAVEPRASVLAMLLSLALALAGAHRLALVVLVCLTVGALAGLQLDDLPPAGR